MFCRLENFGSGLETKCGVLTMSSAGEMLETHNKRKDCNDAGVLDMVCEENVGLYIEKK